MHTDLMVGAESAASYTGLSRRTVYRLVDEGRLPVVRKGRRLYFRRSELDRTFSAKEAV